MLAKAGGPRLVALNSQAQDLGLQTDQLLTDARALVPELQVCTADPAADRQALHQLVAWCGRYTPWAAPWLAWGEALTVGHETPETTGLFLDVTGVAHLFGGEAALLEQLLARLAAAGIKARGALAPTPGAAWALSRYGDQNACTVPPESAEQPRLAAMLAPLPVAALRLTSRVQAMLWSFGLKTIEALMTPPRGPLTTRLGPEVLWRLDQALGRQPEPITPHATARRYGVRQVLAEPLTDWLCVQEGVRRLMPDLVAALAVDGRGARRLNLTLHRVDGAVSRVRVGTARPVAQAHRLTRLLTEKVQRLGPEADLGFGIEIMVLEATRTARLPVCQHRLPQHREPVAADAVPLEDLTDRLVSRLGAQCVYRLAPVNSHQPERAVMRVPAGTRSWPGEEGAPEWPRRPLALLPRAEPVDVLAGIPDGPPRLFRWRKRTVHVARADGPERIAPDWWRLDRAAMQTRDYYHVEDKGGRRFWLCRHGLYDRDIGAPNWYLYGFFA